MSVRPSNIEHTIAGRGRFAATVTRIDLHRLGLQRSEISHSSIAHGHQTSIRDGILFSEKPGVIWKGEELAATDVGLFGYDWPLWYSMAGPSQWGTMSLPTQDLATLSVAMVGRDLTVPRNGLTLTAAPARHAKLLRLHAAAGHLAEHAPDIIHHPEAARGLEQALIEAMFGCMTGEVVHVASDAWGRQAIVLKRFRAALEANIDQPIYIPELCLAIGVPERTLRNHCYEQLGISSQEVLAVAAPESGPPSASRCRSINNDRDGNRDKLRFLGAWPVRRRVPHLVRRVTFGEPEPRTQFETDTLITFR